MQRSLSSIVALIVAAGFLSVLSPGAAAARDRNCSDFSNQRQAQLYFLSIGGPSADPDDLDRDGDGIACDSNPCPCYYGTSAPKPVHHRRTVHSKVSLSVSPRSRIAGESQRLTVQVRPHRVRSVQVQRLRDGSWSTVARRKTSGSGRVTITRATASRTTSYRAVVSKLATSSTIYTAAHGTKVVATTQTQTVALTLPTSARPGARVTARVAASPARKGRAVQVQRHRTDGWHTVASGHESSTGRFSHSLTAGPVGTSDYRAVVQAAHGARRSDSAVMPLVVTAPPDTTPPSAPIGVVATAGDTSVTVTWQPVADADHYVVSLSHFAQGPFSQTAQQPAGSASSVTVTGLVNGTTYFFVVSAVDAAGNSSGPSTTVQATPTDMTPPPVPADVTATAGDTTATVSWSAVTAADLDHYVVHYTPAGGPTVTVTATGTSATITGLSNGTTYSFTVTAVDTAGNPSGPSTTVQATPTDMTPPPVPADVTATAGDTTATVSWSAVTAADLDHYVVHYTPAGGPTVTVTATGTSATITGLNNGTAYSFTVTSVDDDGNESAESTSAVATPSP